MYFIEKLKSYEDISEIELPPGMRQLAVAVLMQAVKDLNNRGLEDDARKFLAGGLWLHHWLSVAGIIDIRDKRGPMERA